MFCLFAPLTRSQQFPRCFKKKKQRTKHVRSQKDRCTTAGNLPSARSSCLPNCKESKLRRGRANLVLDNRAPRLPSARHEDRDNKQFPLLEHFGRQTNFSTSTKRTGTKWTECYFTNQRPHQGQSIQGYRRALALGVGTRQHTNPLGRLSLTQSMPSRSLP